MRKEILISVKLLLIMIILTGAVYPLGITLLGQLLFYDKANGSLYIQDDKIKGSYLIGQEFTSSIWFHARPSAINYNPLPSGASNFSVTNNILAEQKDYRIMSFNDINSLSINNRIPSEMLFASASGVDPHISKKSALLQVNRIAAARKFSRKNVNELYHIIDSLTEYQLFGLPGNEFINVLKLNIKLDEMKK